MRVKELRERLSLLDDNMMIVVHGYEGGVNEMTDVEIVPIKLNVHTAWYYGNHERIITPSDGEPDCMACQLT